MTTGNNIIERTEVKYLWSPKYFAGILIQENFSYCVLSEMLVQWKVYCCKVKWANGCFGSLRWCRETVCRMLAAPEITFHLFEILRTGADLTKLTCSLRCSLIMLGAK